MEKVERKTLWNRIFHRKELKQQRKERDRCRHVVDTAENFLARLDRAEELRQLMAIHKDLWGSGFRNKNIGPCLYEMFRTKDILQMKPEEVYLGNIYGLWTFTIPEWEKEKGHRFGANDWGLSPDMTVYELVAWQYRHLLLTNVQAIRDDARQKLDLMKEQ